MVLTHHYTYQLSGDMATSWTSLHFFHNDVDLFFIITGYLFAPFLIGNKKIDIYKFFKRRFFRLYPLYLLSLLTFIIIATDNISPISLLLEHIFLIQALPYHFLSETGAISLVYWTLAVEFQFYLLVIILSILYKYITIKNKRNSCFCRWPKLCRLSIPRNHDSLDAGNRYLQWASNSSGDRHNLIVSMGCEQIYRDPLQRIWPKTALPDLISQQPETRTCPY